MPKIISRKKDDPLLEELDILEWVVARINTFTLAQNDNSIEATNRDLCLSRSNSSSFPEGRSFDDLPLEGESQTKQQQKTKNLGSVQTQEDKVPALLKWDSLCLFYSQLYYLDPTWLTDSGTRTALESTSTASQPQPTAATATSTAGAATVTAAKVTAGWTKSNSSNSQLVQWKMWSNYLLSRLMKLYWKIVGSFFNAEKFCPFTKHELQSSREKEENKIIWDECSTMVLIDRAFSCVSVTINSYLLWIVSITWRHITEPGIEE